MVSRFAGSQHWPYVNIWWGTACAEQLPNEPGQSASYVGRLHALTLSNCVVHHIFIERSCHAKQVCRGFDEHCFQALALRL